ncbi:DUF29 domain-containing protein [Myxacorys almedinensis]|uniref:DUF29 family protein n=1 Tax=Myxacorys almedinensis A TaxID=2690445 RepID=A0A8J8CKP9_9CYAN|nr:DUF29 domain-containing protein [Myxacorys almedinensis]NDJ16880.1 DUF29 family protein [Myxacorys almedinensis A]
MNIHLQTKLYETDYLKWIETTVSNLKDRDYTNIDWDNLIEEIEDLGRGERRGFESNLTIVLIHLLKWHYQPEKRSISWQNSIAEHRRRIRKALRDSPSLQPFLEEIIPESYTDAIEQAAIQTRLSPETFPPVCPYSVIKILDSSFLPESSSNQTHK